MSTSVLLVEQVEPELQIDDLLDQIDFWARRLGRAFHLSDADRSDVRQELALVVVRAMQRHDNSRSCANTFASRVLDRHCRYLARRFATHRRRKVMCPESLSANVTAEPAENDPGQGENSEQDCVHLRIDVRDVVAMLPERLQQISEALMIHEPSEVAERFGLHRSTVYRYIRQIRVQMVEAGFDGVA